MSIVDSFWKRMAQTEDPRNHPHFDQAMALAENVGRNEKGLENNAILFDYLSESGLLEHPVHQEIFRNLSGDSTLIRKFVDELLVDGVSDEVVEGLIGYVYEDRYVLYLESYAEVAGMLEQIYTAMGDTESYYVDISRWVGPEYLIELYDGRWMDDGWGAKRHVDQYTKESLYDDYNDVDEGDEEINSYEL